MSNHVSTELLSFTLVKDKVCVALSDTIKKSIHELGTDAKCIPWFSSKADQNYAYKLDSAA